MNPKYVITDNFKSSEADRKASLLKVLAKYINAGTKAPSGKK